MKIFEGAMISDQPGVFMETFLTLLVTICLLWLIANMLSDVIVQVTIMTIALLAIISLGILFIYKFGAFLHTLPWQFYAVIIYPIFFAIVFSQTKAWIKKKSFFKKKPTYLEIKRKKYEENLAREIDEKRLAWEREDREKIKRAMKGL